AGEGQDHVHHSHEEQIHETPVPPAEAPQNHPEGQGDGHHGHARPDGPPSPIEHPGEEVPPHLIGAEPVPGRGWLKAPGEVHPVRIVRRQPRREEGGEEHDGHHPTREGGQAVPPGEAPPAPAHPHPDPLIRPGRAARPPAQERRYPVPFGRPGYPMARILGSKRSVTKSTTRLTTVYPVATTRVKPMMAGKSRKAMESTT